MSAKFEKHSLKTVREVDYTNLIPDSAKKKLPKMTKFKKSFLWQATIYYAKQIFYMLYQISDIGFKISNIVYQISNIVYKIYTK